MLVLYSDDDQDIIPPYGFIHRPSALWRLSENPASQVDDDSRRETADQARDPRARVVDYNSVLLPATSDGHPALQLRAQIQLYATNRCCDRASLQVGSNEQTSQLTHSLVSPILASSLGNLCPLYIIVGDKEVLRDEGVYFAHRAADPSRYPVRNGVQQSERQIAGAKRFTEPTRVRLP